MNPFGMPMGMNMNMNNMNMNMNNMNNMNMMMPMMGMGMNMNMPLNMGVSGGMPNMNMDDDDWMQGFKMGVEEIKFQGGDDDKNSPGPKINIHFTTTVGTARNVVCNHGTTIDEALKKYLKLVGRPDLIGKEQDIGFLFNANKVSFGNNTPVEVFFRNVAVPKIVVNDTKGLIGALN